MQNRVAAVAATNSVSFERPAPKAPPEKREAAPRPAPRSDLADVRLIIEENDEAGAYVYKTVDRRTGEVISQIPREEVLKMKERPDYDVGDLISTVV
mgnify:FL=1